MGDFVRSNRTDLLGIQGNDGCGAPLEGNELDLVTLAVGVDVDDGTDVASLQTFGREVGLEDDAIMFGDHGASSPGRGYAVTKRGAAAPRSTIQTVRTR